VVQLATGRTKAWISLPVHSLRLDGRSDMLRASADGPWSISFVDGSGLWDRRTGTERPRALDHGSFIGASFVR
jgi:hypothetical protein